MEWLSELCYSRIAGVIFLLFAVSCNNASEGPSAFVIVGDDGTVGRYVGETEKWYHGDIQDDYWVEKDKARIEEVKAGDGKGIITLKYPGTEPVFICPDSGSDVIGTMIFEQGYVPEVYPCLGYSDGWFLTEIDGRSGYVSEDQVAWDAVNSF